ncbi:hypothetical protein ATANTOWER_023181 [Ataeniobius toweri]|uniref:Uncharacterized protein n=1 Tax=Ataeniobius toweri TaxID=208326 RepID=A0ABU7BV60_9TELE|nr:hypothetical protein [Ataeniobius toweri]
MRNLPRAGSCSMDQIMVESTSLHITLFSVCVFTYTHTNRTGPDDHQREVPSMHPDQTSKPPQLLVLMW